MSNTMRYRGHFARVEYDDEDRIFFGRLAGINDVVSFHGDTVADLKAAFHEIVDDYIETCAKIGKSPEKPYSGNLMLRVDPSVHAKAALAAELAGKSLNQWGEEVLAAAAKRQVG
jgi:predicted HicB family RNase H-like nuclease